MTHACHREIVLVVHIYAWYFKGKYNILKREFILKK